MAQGQAELSLAGRDLDAAEAHAQRSLAWAQGPGGAAELVPEALRVLGLVNTYRMQVGRARVQLERAADLFARLGATVGLADALRFLGYLDQETGRHGDARGHYLEAARHYREIPDPYGEANSLRGAAHVSVMLGDLDGAQALYEQAVALLRPFGVSSALASTENGLGDVQAQRHNLDEALAAYRRALSMYEQVSDGLGTPVALDSIARILRERGDFEGALALLERGLGIIDPQHALGLHLAANHRLVLARARRFDELEAALAGMDAPAGPVRDALRLCRLALASERGDAAAADAALRDGGAGWAQDDGPALLDEAASAWAARSGADAATRAARILRLTPPTPARREALARLRGAGGRVPVDGFELDARLGSGGMGAVWRGRRREDDLAVAVKVLHVGRGPASSLAREIRAMAALDHPGIVRVLGHGTLDLAAQEMSGGELVAGSPYLAMELVAGGDLGRLRGRLGWDELRRILSELLSALAHAHARGLVHLDLKPENVLVTAGSPGRVRLTDLGIARALQELHEAEGIVGTPAYMAPEQATGAWTDIGPWTDLYALGCLTWAMLTGAPPFFHADARRLLLQHVAAPLPPLSPACAVPADLEAWLHRLLAKDPAARFGRAREAAAALDGLGAATMPARSPPVAPPSDTSTWRIGTTVTVETPHAIAAGPPPRRASATVELTWDTRAYPSGGTGGAASAIADRSLFAWRRPPLVGREAERTLLLELLREAAAGEARAVLIRGPAGTGASRLAEWLAETAHAAGADVARVPGPATGDRPLVIVLDDVHDDPAAIGAAVAALTSDQRLLVVLTAREDRVSEAELAPLEAWGLRHLALEPLSREDLAEVLAQRLALHPQLQARLLDRAAGNPQYALQVVAGWIERDALLASPEGLVLKPGVPVALPAGLADAWAARLDAACAPDSAAREAIELAAILGSEVSAAEWATAARTAGLDAADAPVEALVGARLAVRRGAGWSFAHAMAREALLAGVVADRLPRLHAAAARVLEGVAGAEGRRGLHLASSGDPLAALEPLRRGAEAAARSGSPVRAAELIDAWGRCADAAGLPAEDARRRELASLVG